MKECRDGPKYNYDRIELRKSETIDTTIAKLDRLSSWITALADLHLQLFFEHTFQKKIIEIKI